jgi:hypothetical protein
LIFYIKQKATFKLIGDNHLVAERERMMKNLAEDLKFYEDMILVVHKNMRNLKKR